MKPIADHAHGLWWLWLGAVFVHNSPINKCNVYIENAAINVKILLLYHMKVLSFEITVPAKCPLAIFCALCKLLLDYIPI